MCWACEGPAGAGAPGRGGERGRCRAWLGSQQGSGPEASPGPAGRPRAPSPRTLESLDSAAPPGESGRGRGPRGGKGSPSPALSSLFVLRSSQGPGRPDARGEGKSLQAPRAAPPPAPLGLRGCVGGGCSWVCAGNGRRVLEGVLSPCGPRWFPAHLSKPGIESRVSGARGGCGGEADSAVTRGRGGFLQARARPGLGRRVLATAASRLAVGDLPSLRSSLLALKRLGAGVPAAQIPSGRDLNGNVGTPVILPWRRY